MSSDYLSRLSRLCEVLADICGRIERRSERSAACTADAYANSQMLKTLLPARDAMQAHHDFCVRHRGQQGSLPSAVRDEYFDGIVNVAQVADDLEMLAGSRLNRVGHAPGSLQRLSPLFLEMVLRERAQIDCLQAEIRALLRQDIEALKNMPRAGAAKRSHLQLVPTERQAP
ncbi:MAG: hypothetical protein HYS17_10750 [Micavibrio aeruginosavorus]|uniref:Uncharacterized protein n=1 Tax=Micavibrio aeruginosavorus TaxID=349221 RepID=A0A7T5R1S4_9BACT|nr:MAG: hypothetical protein HYS17_10750 [Micavibrio aeruginosavorus]